MHNVIVSALLALLSMISFSAFAANLYKWVDEEGNVHFSQTPPQEEPAAQVDEVQVRDDRTVKPTKVGRDVYCGKERLNRMGDRAAVRIANLEQYLIDRRRRIEEIKARRLDAVERSMQYRHSPTEVSRYDAEISVELCKIDWAESELAALAGERNKISERMQQISSGIAEIEQQKILHCGEDNRTGIIVRNEAYRIYQECIRPYDREIEKLRREKRSVERDAELINRQ